MTFQAILMIALLALTSVLAAAPATGRATIYPAPKGEPASQDYQVFVNGKQVFCYTSFRYDTDSKQTIAGKRLVPDDHRIKKNQWVRDVKVR